eukprot:TRINITY_DN19788_c0_g1_i1.p1 TRINITY_DN19788_c0_g1~~TRINITY_DN19788_c0_g1_i1.p1  ORF type:complete len:150 (-),score=50.46 TRINITY_DN19788_c0_g1_i1:31-480(-)
MNVYIVYNFTFIYNDFNYICINVSFLCFFFFFSSRRRHTRCREVSWARRCVQETVSTQSTWGQPQRYLKGKKKCLNLQRLRLQQGWLEKKDGSVLDWIPAFSSAFPELKKEEIISEIFGEKYSSTEELSKHPEELEEFLESHILSVLQS